MPCDDCLRVSESSQAQSASSLAKRLLAGDRRALARGISLVEDDSPDGWALVREIYPHTGSAAIYGFTGPPGAGKSTLIAALTKARRSQGRTVAVLSIDPSSPFTEGALLGDRIRLTEHFLDRGVFIRSMANRGALGGLSEAALQATLLLDAAGHEEIFIETVGVGQAEIDIIDHADTVVLVLMPGSGDSIQALKAGVMEIPDVIVVDKAEHPLTDTMVRELRGVLSLANLEEAAGSARRWRVPIVRTEASRQEGIEELVEQLALHREHILAAGELEQRRRRNLKAEVLSLATARLRRALEQGLGGGHGVQADARGGGPAPARPRERGGHPAENVRPRLRSQRAGDNHLLHLVSALADREDLRVPVEAADGVLLDVTVAAVGSGRPPPRSARRGVPS